jgi:hypothetical protein
MTERVLFTAEEFEIPTPASTSIATNVISRNRWDSVNLNSKPDFA